MRVSKHLLNTLKRTVFYVFKNVLFCGFVYQEICDWLHVAICVVISVCVDKLTTRTVATP